MLPFNSHGCQYSEDWNIPLGRLDNAERERESSNKDQPKAPDDGITELKPIAVSSITGTKNRAMVRIEQEIGLPTSPRLIEQPKKTRRPKRAFTRYEKR